MKFNPITKNLFTDDHVLIKKLHCPFRVGLSELSPAENGRDFCCNLCDETITDTSDLTDEMVVQIVRQNASVCLKVDINQPNVRVVSRDV